MVDIKVLQEKLKRYENSKSNSTFSIKNKSKDKIDRIANKRHGRKNQSKVVDDMVEVYDGK